VNYYFDTSALLKRYIHEDGSDRVDSIIVSASKIFVSLICELEVRSVLRRLLQMKEIDPSEVVSIATQFERDLELFSIVPIVDAVIVNAKMAIDRHQLRSLDSIQFGSFVYVQKEAKCFVSGDVKLVAACRKEQLRYIQP
jgi:predicted nucleic acid-binding protein